MNERSFIVKSFDKIDSNTGISPSRPQRIGRNSSSEFQTRSGLPLKAYPSNRALL
jgi:hypothetical protein